MRYLLLFCMFTSLIACNNKTLTKEQKESVLLEEFEATKNLIGQSKFMTTERTNQWIQDFTAKLKLDPKDVEKNGFKLNILNAKAMQLGIGNTISFQSTWELMFVSDTTDAEGKVLRKQLPSRRSVIYLWDPTTSSIQSVLDSGFIVEATK